VKNIRYFSNGKNTIEWNIEACTHLGKCFKNMPNNIEKPGIYCIKVSDRQFEALLKQMRFCPEKALKLKVEK